MRRRWTNRGHSQNIVAVWSAVPTNELCVCYHSHPADGTFDPRGPLVCTICPNVLAEVNKEVKYWVMKHAWFMHIMLYRTLLYPCMK